MAALVYLMPYLSISSTIDVMQRKNRERASERDAIGYSTPSINAQIVTTSLLFNVGFRVPLFHTNL